MAAEDLIDTHKRINRSAARKYEIIKNIKITIPRTYNERIAIGAA